MKYSFFELKCDAEKKSIPLPDDVNIFIKEWLAKNGYADALPIIEKKETTIQYGEIAVLNVSNPNREIVIGFQCGMIPGFDIITKSTIGLIMIEDKTHILNPALDMSRKRKENGPRENTSND